MAYEIALEGKTALVTGAGQGVGRAVAETLAAAGARVVVNDLFADRASAVVAGIIAEGGAAVAAPFDVTDHTEVGRAVVAAGPIDVLVNNAGNAGSEQFVMKPFVETAPDEWGRFIDVNLLGVMHCTHAALPAMIERRGGRIVTVISDAGRRGEPNMAAYAAAKAGAAGFMRSIALEVGRFEITVNCVALGTIDTGARGDVTTDPEAAERLRRQMRAYIIRRPGLPADVAGLVTFLASDAASWVTGQTYALNGGYSLGM